MPPDSTNFLRHLLDPNQWTLLEVLGVAAGIISTIIAILPYLKRRRLRPLSEFYTPEDIERSTTYYIESDCQKSDPAYDDPNSNYQHPSRSGAFGLFDIMLRDPDKNKFILLLGDTGIGKTSFAINYFIRSLQQHSKYRIRVLPLNRPEVDDVIKKIRNKPKTILFLDALDEDRHAIGRIELRVSELCQLAVGFRNVVITCRSQFFPREIEIPEETGAIRISALGLFDQKGYVFQKCYLTPFSASQVETFLNLKYKQEDSRQKARLLIQNIEHLVIRPLILANLDYLLRNPTRYKYSSQLYEAIIQAWLDREKGNFDIRNTTPLRLFCERLTLELALQREAQGIEYLPHTKVTTLAKRFDINVETWKLTSRSLLNRDAQDNFKFAHRSIQEYLFVSQCFVGFGDRIPRVLWTAQMYRFFWEILQGFRETNAPMYKSIEQIVDFAELIRVVGVKFELIRFRSKPQTLTKEDVEKMIRQKNFYDIHKNKTARENAHYYVRYKQNIVTDYVTGLTWQQSGASQRLMYADAEKYVSDLNDQKFAGFSDWRLPTLEEAMSLMEPQKKCANLFIDPVFEPAQNRIWTADASSSRAAWGVAFDDGYCLECDIRYGLSVRTVRSGQS